VSGGSYRRVESMEEAFADADVVYPKSWAPFAVMEERTQLVEERRFDELEALEKRCLTNNAEFTDWECTEELMKGTRDGSALYLHCLPVDISGISCKKGEVAASVFDRYRIPLYKEASFKPYIIAAMILLSKSRNPAEALRKIMESGVNRVV
jgi:ornithine carbamoyltransferase